MAKIDCKMKVYVVEGRFKNGAWRVINAFPNFRPAVKERRRLEIANRGIALYKVTPYIPYFEGRRW